ncbi:transcriptional regulator [Erwinia sp. Leaf53]|uniref:helix-turn-helix transcriptional regulator n=1 Tax=Erwinia sp. Leaf53 TaxID=1736225 RepID=UPI0006F6E95C|nr:PAS domain-containing protein [Erwinia sp. Leaf53]KQN63061.1 hypothetical protein ASF13_20605 [Erwinia sp. Leaf53]
MSSLNDELSRERERVFETLRAALSALGSVVGRDTEIVLHDLSAPETSVMAIANGHVTGRMAGSSVLAVPDQDLGLSALINSVPDGGDTTPLVIPDYATRNKQGQTLRSATALYRDSSGQPFAALCINSDQNALLAAREAIDRLLSGQPSPAVQAASAPESADMEQLMAEIIADSLVELETGPRSARKQAKLAAVRRMQERGMFIVKGGIEKAAAALGVTRYTIYNYLEEIRSRAEQE